MREFFASGLVVDVILGLMLVEALLLTMIRTRTGSGVPVPDLLINLAAGGCLLLAMRSALLGADWKATAACLVGALTAHLTDLQRRWLASARGSSSPPPTTDS